MKFKLRVKLLHMRKKGGWLVLPHICLNPREFYDMPSIFPSSMLAIV